MKSVPVKLSAVPAVPSGTVDAMGVQPVPLPVPEVATEEAEALLEPVLLEKAFCGPVPAAQAMAGSFSATLKMEPLPVLKTWCRRRPVLAELAEALAGPLVDTLSALEEAGAFLVTLSAEDVTGLPGGVPAPVLLAIAVAGCPGAPFATADFTPVTTSGTPATDCPEGGAATVVGLTGVTSARAGAAASTSGARAAATPAAALLARQVKLPETLRPQLHWGLMEGTGMESTFWQALRPMKTDGSLHVPRLKLMRLMPLTLPVMVTLLLVLRSQTLLTPARSTVTLVLVPNRKTLPVPEARTVALAMVPLKTVCPVPEVWISRLSTSKPRTLMLPLLKVETSVKFGAEKPGATDTSVRGLLTTRRSKASLGRKTCTLMGACVSKDLVVSMSSVPFLTVAEMAPSTWLSATAEML